MSDVDLIENSLNRRAWIIMAGTALSACGGSGSGQYAGSPGTGGTGSPLYAQGSIAGFGSVIVNGITFNDVQAQVQLNGVAATSADLRLGMVADIEGERGIDLTMATATRIEVWSIGQGVISQIVGSDFVVSGMTIQTKANTVFDGVAAVSQLRVGQAVAVWGLQVSADGNVWQATRVATLPAVTQVVSSGQVLVANQQVSLNAWVLTGSKLAELAAGSLVRVEGVPSVDGLGLNVTQVRSLAAAAVNPSEGEVEIEGFVTALVAGSQLTLGNIEVDISNASYSPVGAQIGLGARVEIYGTWVAGLLKARRVELEDEQSAHVTEISGTITSFSSIASFIVRGQRCDASTAEISHGNASDLKVGVQIKVKGSTVGDVLLVTKLEFDD
ncbi:MAG: DUF5666 domain-containing protein [Rhodoferax sp.]|uniref:DUF5666 domain-containing protein n=1 Tax=Rhodoferax sp. TaxID=50421 RepID=UPI00263161B2|nr:DUF5666 domain-containing protein [Rhodoferax sp.]MDD2880053.1 DUF5666 domain-containing protein [Rhodoferax sp.]